MLQAVARGRDHEPAGPPQGRIAERAARTQSRGRSPRQPSRASPACSVTRRLPRQTRCAAPPISASFSSRRPAILPIGSTSSTAPRSNVVAAGLAHLDHGRSTVLAHAGQHQAESVAPRHHGGTPKQHLHARAVPVDGRSVIELHHVVGAAARQLHVPVARRDVGMARQHALAVHCLADGDLAQRVQPRGEALGEAHGHVLRDQDRGRIGRQAHQHLADRLGASGGGADDDELLGRQAREVHRSRLGFTRDVLRRRCGSDMALHARP